MEQGEGSVGPEYDPVKAQRSPGEDNWHLLAAYPPPAAPAQTHAPLGSTLICTAFSPIVPILPSLASFSLRSN